MARYEHLPLYKVAMDLTVYIEQVVRQFSRYHKYTLGSELRQQSRELVTLIIRANSRREKLPVLYDLRERLLQETVSGTVLPSPRFRQTPTPILRRNQPGGRDESGVQGQRLRSD